MNLKNKVMEEYANAVGMRKKTTNKRDIKTIY